MECYKYKFCRANLKEDPQKELPRLPMDGQISDLINNRWGIRYKRYSVLSDNSFHFMGRCHFTLYGMIEKIFVTKLSPSYWWISFKFGVSLCIDGVYIVSFVYCCPILTPVPLRVCLSRKRLQHRYLFYFTLVL